jgi:hypothetical protein
MAGRAIPGTDIGAAYASAPPLSNTRNTSTHNPDMTLPKEIAAAVVAAAAKELAASVCGQIDDLQLVTIGRAAAILGVSEPKARRLIKSYVDLGEASKRVRVTTLRKLIEERTTA